MNPTALLEDTLLNEQAADELMQWELRIAQRADQLAARAEPRSQEDLVYWLQAEREILAQLQVTSSDLATY
jgi:hypothetical protein